MVSRIVASLARKAGTKALDLAVDRLFPAPARPSASAAPPPLAPPEPAKPAPSLGKTLASGALLKIATRSVPGAIIIGGGWLAKTLYDRRHADRQRPSTDG